MEEVKLFGFWVSSFCRRVEIALKLKGIHYQYTEEDLCNKSPLLLQYNPVHKKIPVLLHNGNPITESLVILEYIDQTWKGNYPILPEDPYEKAIQRFWAKFFDDKLMPALWKTIFSTGEEQGKVKEEACELLKVLENELKDKKFFGGDAIGFVDIAANFLAFSFRAIQEALRMDIFTDERFPKLWKWAEEYVNCDVIKETLPPKDKLIANFPPPYMGNSVAAIFQSRLAMASSAAPK